MSGFACICLRCESEFTEPVPRVFCPPCRPAVVEEMAEHIMQFYIDHPDFPMPGDTVRRRTQDDADFELAVMTDLADL
jgi:hypothetical protein